MEDQKENFATFYANWSSASKTLNCILTFKSLARDVSVGMEPHMVTLSNGRRCMKFQLDHLELQPDTCRGLNYLPNGELQFSVQGKSLTSNDDDIIVFRENMLMSQNELVERIQMLPDKWFCERCHNKILRDEITFSRVLPLPSENWSDFADTWFCHNHGNDTPHQQTSLLPKSTECFVGDTYILVDRQHVNPGVVKVTTEGAILCHRCGQQLGVTIGVKNGSVRHSSVFKMFVHAVTISEEVKSSPGHKPNMSRQHRDVFFSRLLREQSQLFTSFRFLIEGKQETSPNTGSQSTCLVWLLDTCVGQYTTCGHSFHKKKVSTLERLTVSKVMFKCQLQSSASSTDSMMKALISLWRRDEAVHSLMLPQAVLLQMVQILVDNCQSLPPSQRYLNGFHVSFLRNDTGD